MCYVYGTGEDIITGQIAHERSLEVTKVVGRSLLEIRRNKIANISGQNGIAQGGTMVE